MRQEPCKAHGYVFPADADLKQAIDTALESWNISECTLLEGEIFNLDFEGVFFPLDDVIKALQPYLHDQNSLSACQPKRSGKIDVFDLEKWTLTRALITGTTIHVSTVGLNHVLDYSGF